MSKREIVLYKKNKPCSKLDVSIEELDFIMQTSEDVEAICKATQIINLNNYTISNDRNIILKHLEYYNLKPFIFISILN